MSSLMTCALSAGGALLLLLLPISVTLSCHLDIAARKLFFGVRLCHVLRLAGGYAEPRAEGIAVHLSAKKALLFPYLQMLRSRPDLNKLHGFRLTRIRIFLTTGQLESAPGILSIAAASSLGAILGPVLKERGCRFRSDILLGGTSGGTATAAGEVRTRFLYVLILLFKLAWEAIIKWIKTRKQSA